MLTDRSLGQNKLVQFKPKWVNLGQVKVGQVKSGQDKVGQVKSVQVDLGQVSTGQNGFTWDSSVALLSPTCLSFY